MNYLLVFIGGGLGSMVRFFISSLLPNSSLPYATLISNFISSFILGLLVCFYPLSPTISPNYRVFIAVGFCGGFSTFSTFSLETFQLLNNQQLGLALINITLNVFLCLIAIFLAYYMKQVSYN